MCIAAVPYFCAIVDSWQGLAGVGMLGASPIAVWRLWRGPASNRLFNLVFLCADLILIIIAIFLADFRPAEAMTQIQNAQERRMNGDTAAAQRYYRRARDLFVAADRPGEAAKVLSELADMVGQAGHYEAAHAHLKASLKLYRSANNEIGEASVLLSIASLAIERNRLDAAESAIAEAADIYHRHDEAGMASIWLVQGQMAYHRGDLARAADLFARARSSYCRADCALGEAQATYSLAIIDKDQGRFLAARRGFAAALELFKANDEEYGAAMSSLGLARTIMATGDATTAAQHFREAADEFALVGLIDRQKQAAELAKQAEEKSAGNR